MNMILSKTIESSVRKGVVYGNQGDTIKVIKDDGQVAIVEDKFGNRFPVKSDFLTKDYQPETTIGHKPEPIINRVPPKAKKAKGVPIKQNSLFL
jgi:hypothetical protein